MYMHVLTYNRTESIVKQLYRHKSLQWIYYSRNYNLVTSLYTDSIKTSHVHVTSSAGKNDCHK